MRLDVLRERLRSLYLTDGIAYQGERGPIVGVDGQSARWMIDSLGFSLTEGGAALAADALLKLLERFEGRQLATYGTIGMPLMQSVVLRSKGKYRGLVVRKEVKDYGARRRIEGRVDHRQPVVLIDDSISTGDSMIQCARYLAEAGLEVEGGVFLTRFGFDGVSRLQAELGVPMHVLFDVERDFYAGIPGEEAPLANPLKAMPELRWSKQRLEEGLDPCEAARRVMHQWLTHGTAPRPPKRFDAVMPHQGGSFVSLRDRHDIHDRPAREGFWHLPGEQAGPQTEELVLAAVQTAEALKQAPEPPLEVLARCAVAVTTFSKLEKVPLSKVDDRKHGIVVRSLERPWVMGGGLPRMPGLRNPWELFKHAGLRNAQLLPTERFEILRHEVFKRVEPGIEWQPAGVAAPLGRDPEEHARVVAPLVQRALAEVNGFLGATAPEAGEPAWPEGVQQLFLSVFLGGQLRGCAGTEAGPDAATLRDLARAAVSDPRFTAAEGEPAVVVSFLRNRQLVGAADTDWMARVTRYGEQAIEVAQEERSALLLPAVVTYQGHGRKSLAEAAIEKAQLRAPPYLFTLHDVVSWGGSAQGVVKMRGALTERPPLPAAALSQALQGFLERTHSARGEPYVRYVLYEDVLKSDWAGPWLAHRAWVKARLGLGRQAREDLARFRVARGGQLTLNRAPCGLAEQAFATLAHLELGQRQKAKPLAQALLAAIAPNGRFEGPQGEEQDYFPYQALLALAAAVAQQVVPRSAALELAFAHYRRRFRGNHAWGSYAWAAQAFTAWGLATKDRSFLELSCEVADFGLDSQDEKEGCFYTPDEPEAPSAMTAVYLEGVAAALQAARALKSAPRVRRYQAAFDRGVRFLSTLLVGESDRFFVPNFAWASGGLRSHAHSPEVRLDYVQHALNALRVAGRGVLPRATKEKR